MVTIIWTDFALEDLDLIHQYISKDSKFYADRYIDKIIKRVDILENHPKKGRVVPEFELDTIREIIEGNYRIIYKIFFLEISILRIHQTARKLKNISF